jgi:prepilin-type N-terminal cleavage/methylation domain-containing protein
MRAAKGFTLVEILVVIMIIGILLAMTMPRFTVFREQARVSAMKMNLHNVQTVIEAYHAEKGYYADDFYEDEYGWYFPGGIEDVQMGKLPTNPWTGREMDPDEFNVEDYDFESDCSNVSENGPNDQYGYYPGEVVYGVFDPPGTLHPTHYGLVGIEGHGQSMRTFNADDEIVMFVLHN